MKTVILYGPHNLKLEDVESPKFNKEQALIRVKASGICGSDVECYEGRSIQGLFPYTPGHEWCGEVVDVGETVTTLKRGDKVVAETVERCGICDRCRMGMHAALCRNPRTYGFEPKTPGGFAEYAVRTEKSLYKLPPDVSFEEGALVEPFSVGYFGVWTAGGGVEATDDVAIFGLGPIGLFALAAVKVAGARTICVDPIKKRQELALRFGADAVIDPSQKDATKEILNFTNGTGADLVVDASGNVDAIARTVDVADIGGRIALVGNSFGKTISVELWKTVLKGLTIRGSAGDSFPQAIELIANKKVNLAPMVSHRFPLERVGEAFELAAKRVESIKIIVLP